MCTVCGCGQAKVEGHDHGHEHHHHHDHEHHRHDYGQGLGGVHVPGMDETRIVQVEQDILSENDRLAAVNRARLAETGTFALNLVSSPGSGKTTLLCRTLRDLQGARPVAVIEGDQQTDFDADRIRETGVPAVQVNTGKGCHLDAHMVGHALDTLTLEPGGLLFIENVGNLVCPSAFDLGEAHKVAVLSVTEGEDKPLKYPDMFHAADLLVLNKVDLLPHLEFDVERCLDYARRIKPDIEVLQVSATRGDGLDAWYAWIERGAEAARGAVVA